MTALVLGATGATGRALTEQLLADEQFTEVQIFTRRNSGFFHPKLKELVVDFDSEAAFAQVEQADAAFSAVGTTRKDAGSRAAQWKVEFTYQLNFARACRAAGVSTFALVSSVGANPKSGAFYLKLKGQVEEAVAALGFPTTLFFRPPSLIRPDTDRPAEKVSIKVLNFLNSFGILMKMKPLRVEDLAAKMIASAKAGLHGQHIIEPY